MTTLDLPFPEGQPIPHEAALDPSIQAMLDELPVVFGDFSIDKVSTGAGIANSCKSVAAPAISRSLPLRLSVCGSSPSLIKTEEHQNNRHEDEDAGEATAIDTDEQRAWLRSVREARNKNGRLRYPYRAPRKPKPSVVVRLVHWRHLDELECDTAIDRYLVSHGGIAFTLRFHHETELMLRAAAANGRNIAQVIADRINRQFRARDLKAPAMRFRIETSPLRRKLHVHGVMLPGALPLDALGKCLKAAGSEFDDLYVHKQLDLKPFCNRVEGRWWRYGGKHRARIEAELGTDKLTHTSRSLLQFVRDDHETRRLEARKPITVTAVLEDFSQDAADSTTEAAPVSYSPALTQGSPLTGMAGFEPSDSRRDTETHQRPAMAVLKHVPSPATVERSNRGPP